VVSGSQELLTYEIEELLATNCDSISAKKGRDLYDLAAAIQRIQRLDFAKIVDCFNRYLEHEGLRVSRAEFEANLAEKMEDPEFHVTSGRCLSGRIPRRCFQKWRLSN